MALQLTRWLTTATTVQQQHYDTFFAVHSSTRPLVVCSLASSPGLPHHRIAFGATVFNHGAVADPTSGLGNRWASVLVIHLPERVLRRRHVRSNFTRDCCQNKRYMELRGEVVKNNTMLQRWSQHKLMMTSSNLFGNLRC